MRERVLSHLAALVGFDTRNPPRRIGAGGIFDYLRANLPGFEFDLQDHGAGAVSLLACRGQGARVFNVHLDTVPDSPGWSADPHVLRVTGERAIGLGACDTKGAAACLLAAAEQSDGPLALLFSSDEEANDARCIAAFLATDRGFREAIVAEPTQAQAVLAHRGISSARIAFHGRAGHASAPDAIAQSAVHQALRWGAQALAHAEAQAHARFGGLTGLRFNVGRVEGGIKGNVVAPSCEALFNFRPLPSQDTDALHAAFRGCAHAPALAAYEERFRGPSLPAGDIALAEERRLAARDLADELGLPIGNAVDFWTEASLFSAAGYTALVYGPGDIAQAHAADEWVALAQLDEVAATYLRILEGRAVDDLRPTIVRLLSNMASAKEIQQYLKRFSQLDASKFAVVKVGGAILRDELDALVSSLAFLQQVGLTPIVIHGAGPQLDEEMAAAGIVKKTVDGLRYTDPPVLSVVRRVSQQENLRLVEALQAQGVRATSVNSGVFEAELLDQARYGLVGKVVRVHTASITAAIKVRSIPVIASLAETAGGQILNVNADWAANELVKTLQPYKIVFLTGTGGLLDGEGDLIDSINLSTEYEGLMAQPWLHSGMRVKMQQIHDLLMQLPPSSSVSITKPDELAKELFTHRGSGTLVRRGEQVRTFEDWQGLDLDKLKALIESGFGRKLAPDYFEKVHPHRVFVSEHYRAALILTLEEGIPHLDKFAVSEDAQGEGLGRAAWQVMRDATPRLFWRSRWDNPVNDFYFDESDGCVKGEKWNVFWYGLESFDEIRFAVDHCRARPASLKDRA